MNQDKLLPEVIAYAKQQGFIRSSILQLKYKLGYNRAYKLMKQMEEAGIFTDENQGEYWIDRVVKL
ncbi:DNA translocase FtsK [Aquimarina latercula]|uniref:DNA translocase FtsK n=1 Tax=Aquimarina latercula TaxID=987 RepID=UPI000485BF5A|nr:DNA translocase FtsK [Aquimarina latercula]